MDFDATMERYQCHLLAKGLTPDKVQRVLMGIASNPEKWCSRVAKWTQRDPRYEWKMVAREAAYEMSGERFPRTSRVSVHSLMQLGLRAQAAFHVMCAITAIGDDDYVYHYAPWHWLAMHLEQPLDGPGIFGADMHKQINN